MTTYIALLRGINVSGHNMIRMDDLKKIFEDLHLLNVRTYIQSGNVVFRSNVAEPVQLAIDIAKRIKSTTGFDVPVILLTKQELQNIISQNPFIQENVKDPAFLHVTFLTSETSQEKVMEIEARKAAGEEFRILGKAVYLYLPHGYGRTKLNNSLFESKLKVHTTTRNWRTILELARMAGKE